MLKEPYDVLTAFPVRKRKTQKAQFRQAVQAYVQNMGYECHEEAGSLGCRNLVIGNPDSARYLVTAHYDTCARMLVPNLITPCNLALFLLYQAFVCALLLVPSLAVGTLVGYAADSILIGYLVWMVLLWGGIACMLVGPANPSNVNDNTSGVVTLLELVKYLPAQSRKDVCFVLFDLEEAGLIGSAAYRKQHKASIQSQLVLNLDCVGEGDHILLFPTAGLKKQPQKLHMLEKIAGQYGTKEITVRRKGFSIYPSDQANFPYGVGICALNSSRFGLYLSKIHTPRDKVLDETNVNLLRAALLTLLSGSAAQQERK